MLESFHEKIHNTIAEKYQNTKTEFENNTLKYGLWMIRIATLISITMVIAPIEGENAINFGVAAILFISENIIEKHLDPSKQSEWKFAYHCSQALLISSMLLGLPFGIDKGFGVFTIVGTVGLSLICAVAGAQISYSFQKRIAESANPEDNCQHEKFDLPSHQKDEQTEVDEIQRAIEDSHDEWKHNGL